MSIEALAMAGADYRECGIRFELPEAYEEDGESSNAVKMMMMSEGGGGVALPRPPPAEKATEGIKKLRSFSGSGSDLAGEWRMKEKLIAWAKEVASLQAAATAATFNLGCISEISILKNHC